MDYKSDLVKSQTSLPVEKLLSMPNRSLIRSREQLKDFEVPAGFNYDEWTCMTSSEKNQWVKKFLVKTKADLVYVYNQVGEIMDSALNVELISDITSMTEVSSTNYFESIGLKRFQFQRENDRAELKKSNQTIRDLSKKLNKVTHSQETQTGSMEEMDKNPSVVSIENTAMEQNSSKVQRDGLSRDLDSENEEFDIMSEKYSPLESKYENLKNALREKEAHISEKTHELGVAKKYQDHLYEQLMKFQKKLADAESKLLDKIVSANRNQKVTEDNEKIISVLKDQLDELEVDNEEKCIEIICLRRVVSENQSMIEEKNDDITNQNKTIDDLIGIVNEKAKIIAEMKEREQCMVNQSVRDNKRKENKLLTEENRMCSWKNWKRTNRIYEIIDHKLSVNELFEEQNERLKRHIERIKLEKELTVQREPSSVQKFTFTNLACQVIKRLPTIKSVLEVSTVHFLILLPHLQTYYISYTR